MHSWAIFASQENWTCANNRCAAITIFYDEHRISTNETGDARKYQALTFVHIDELIRKTNKNASLQSFNAEEHSQAHIWVSEGKSAGEKTEKMAESVISNCWMRHTIEHSQRTFAHRTHSHPIHDVVKLKDYSSGFMWLIKFVSRMETLTVWMQTDVAGSYAGIRLEPIQLQRYHKLHFVSTSTINLLCKTKYSPLRHLSVFTLSKRKENKRVNKSFVIASERSHIHFISHRYILSA